MLLGIRLGVGEDLTRKLVLSGMRIESAGLGFSQLKGEPFNKICMNVEYIIDLNCE